MKRFFGTTCTYKTNLFLSNRKNMQMLDKNMRLNSSHVLEESDIISKLYWKVTSISTIRKLSVCVQHILGTTIDSCKWKILLSIIHRSMRGQERRGYRAMFQVNIFFHAFLLGEI